MKIGYSFWGFLSDGIQDTPDGGRIHRLPFLRALIATGTQIVCLQADRDFDEAGCRLDIEGLTFQNVDFPELDALICEYRWEIPGRNSIENVGGTGFTPDLERQNALLAYYGNRVPIIVWDKDLKMAENDACPFIVAEAALQPRPGRKKLLFSFDDAIRQSSIHKLTGYSSSRRTVDLVYIGNQYERDASFKRYYDGSGLLLGNRPQVYGNWTKYVDAHAANLQAFPHVQFHDRLPYSDLADVYETAFSTVLIAPERYYALGQITQRMFEALASLVIPFIPVEYQHVEEVALDAFRVNGPQDVVSRIHDFKRRGDTYIRTLLGEQIERLACYAPDLQAYAALEALRSRRCDAH